MRISILVPLALLLLLVGCEVTVDRQALSLRYDYPSDTLEGMCIYEGIAASSKSDLPEALEIVSAYLEGARQIHFGPIGFTEEEMEDTDQSQDDLIWGKRQVAIDSVHLYLDDEGRLSGAQRFHVSNFSRVLSVLNQNLNREIIEDFQDEESEPLEYDARTQELVLRFAQMGWSWVSIEGDEFVFQFPMSLEDWRATQKDFLHWAMEEEPDSGQRLVLQLLGYVQQMGWEDELITIRLGPVFNGVFHFESFYDEDYDDGLLEEVKKAGYILDSDFDSTKARLALDPPAPQER